MPVLGIIASQQQLAPTVTGGTLYTSGGYNYRVFTSNGTLGITGGTLSCDILVVAGGGGGGGYYHGAGGGAGGLRAATGQSFSTNQTVTIGAGGAGGNSTYATSTGGVGGIGATSALINAMGTATGYGQLSSGNYYFAGGGAGNNNAGVAM